jgi:hypothetical protein
MKGKHEFSSRANLVENEGKNEDREEDSNKEEEKGEKKAATTSMDISPMAGGQPITRYNKGLLRGILTKKFVRLSLK